MLMLSCRLKIGFSVYFGLGGGGGWGLPNLEFFLGGGVPNSELWLERGGVEIFFSFRSSSPHTFKWNGPIITMYCFILSIEMCHLNDIKSFLNGFGKNALTIKHFKREILIICINI